MLNIYKTSIYISLFCVVAKLFLAKSADDQYVLEMAEPNAISYIFDAIIMSLSFLFIKRIPKTFHYIIAFFIFSTFTFSVATVFNEGSIFLAVKTALRYFVPILALAHYYSYFKDRENELVNVIYIMIAISLLLVIYGFMTLPMSTNRYFGDNDGLWWPAYFNNLHTTTYVISAIFYMFFCMYIRGRVNKLFLLTVSMLCIYGIAFGWGIRTATISILFIFLCVLIDKLRYRQKYFGLMLIILSLSLLPIWYTYLFDFDLYSRYSSGRLSMYVEKYYQLSENNFLQWIFGNGAGSDLIETDFWWDARGAHSDFITMLVEGGIICLSFFIAIHVKLYNLTKNSHARFIVYSVAVTGLFSNGFFVRPVAMYLCIFALLLGMVDSIKHEKSTSK